MSFLAITAHFFFPRPNGNGVGLPSHSQPLLPHVAGERKKPFRLCPYLKAPDYILPQVAQALPRTVLPPVLRPRRTLMNPDIVYLRYHDGADAAATALAGRHHPQPLMAALVSYLFSHGRYESDVDHATVVVLDECPASVSAPLDRLSLDDKTLAVRYFFGHLNVFVVSLALLADAAQRSELEQAVADVANVVVNRIARVEAWTETGPTIINDNYGTYKLERHGRRAYADVVAPLSYILSANAASLSSTMLRVRAIKQLIVDAIDFRQLLSGFDDDPLHAARLCHAVGVWGFPAHELTNDDLVYCVFLMLKHALSQVPDTHTFDRLSDNELLALVFAVRDTYKLGNPFHNFRHAVDVVQACFHFLLRLGCLPRFSQFNDDATADETAILQATDFADTAAELTVKATAAAASDAYLNPIQTLALLVAALGHDVGHPGVTNAFMIKYHTPALLMVNERLVLELYHTLVFINKILSCYWPSLLAAETTDKLTVRQMVTQLILATDMAEHFEYIAKLNTLKHERFDHDGHKVKLILLLLIKCADILNVTRPLRVSLQWAYVLARETEELALLERKLANDASLTLDLLTDLRYTKVPSKFEDILAANDQLPKGQIFFIDTFAENLFHNIAEYMPELQYAERIISKNKQFWLSR